MIRELPRNPVNGIPLLVIFPLALVGSIVATIMAFANENFVAGIALLLVSLALLVCLVGFFMVAPNEGVVLQLFGAYRGTAREPGLRWANPFYADRKVSLRVRNFETTKLKVNDVRGNPIEIASVVVWRVVDTAEAVFQVDNYENFVHVQSESALRNLASGYAYDGYAEEERGLVGHTAEVSEKLKVEIQERLEKAGVEVLEARISHLAYAQEIAAAMLQRQQAGAVVAARQRIVEGAAGMVETALEMLSAKHILNLDEERRAAMVSRKPASVLATVGVAITALVVAVIAHWAFDLSLVNGFLIGAIVSSTDAAATFAILRGRGVNLPTRLRGILEVESGSNDPMAVFLTTAAIALILGITTEPAAIFVSFLLQMGLGAFYGIALGHLSVRLLNRIDLEYEGLYPVAMLALVLGIYSIAALGKGNGFLAVYIAGLVLARSSFLKKRLLKKFQDGVAWLMQIVMFLTLGLLVFPSRLVPVWQMSILLALSLVFIARPIAVAISLARSSLNLREKTLVAWAGLRGAVPIVLATFPLLAGVEAAGVVFDVVFFVVITSVLMQGTMIAPVARWLGLDEKDTGVRDALGRRGESDLVTIDPGPAATGLRIVELELPEGTLIILIYREGAYFVPQGATRIEEGDRLMIFTSKVSIDTVRARLAAEG